MNPSRGTHWQTYRDDRNPQPPGVRIAPPLETEEHRHGGERQVRRARKRQIWSRHLVGQVRAGFHPGSRIRRPREAARLRKSCQRRPVLDRSAAALRWKWIRCPNPPALGQPAAALAGSLLATKLVPKLMKWWRKQRSSRCSNSSSRACRLRTCRRTLTTSCLKHSPIWYVGACARAVERAS